MHLLQQWLHNILIWPDIRPIVLPDTGYLTKCVDNFLYFVKIKIYGQFCHYLTPTFYVVKRYETNVN